MPGAARTYIYCSDPSTGAFDQFANAIRNNPKWTFREMKTGHDAMITDPEGLAKILLSPLLLAPTIAAMMFPAILAPAFIAELSLSLWLTVKGVNLLKWNERVRKGLVHAVTL